MNITDEQRDVARKISELLPTVDEALQHMLVQLEEIRLEEFGMLYKQTIEVIGMILTTMPPFLPAEEAIFVPMTLALREAVISVTNAYETAKLQEVQSAVASNLIPKFNDWRKEIEIALKPIVNS